MAETLWHELWSNDPETRLPPEGATVWLGWEPCEMYPFGSVEWLSSCDYDDVRTGGLFETATHWALASPPTPPGAPEVTP